MRDEEVEGRVEDELGVLTYEMQSLWDPWQHVITQGVIDGDPEVSRAGQEGRLRAAATHTQNVGNTQRGQLVLNA